LKIFVDIDSNLVEECSKAFEIEQERNEEKKKKRAERWALIMKGG